MGKFVTGTFQCVNPQKYCGDLRKPITYRSSWEFAMMNKFDAHPNVIAWASESITIPYQNPLTKRWTMYVPDFFVVYIDKDGRHHAELIEIKPAKEHPEYVRKKNERISERTKLTQIINAAKWQAAARYCAERKIAFRIATEDSMFGFTRKKRK